MQRNSEINCPINFSLSLFFSGLPVEGNDKLKFVGHFLGVLCESLPSSAVRSWFYSQDVLASPSFMST